MRVKPELFWDVVLSLAGGFLIPLALFFLLLWISGLDFEVPLVERNPFAWMLVWPNLIWSRLLSEEHVGTATLITIVLTYSVITYMVLRLSRRLTR